mgnify:CR=1 FL=1
MKKFVCTVCGYVFEGEAAPAECPVCHAGADKFKEQTGEREWAAEHVIGVAQGVSEDILGRSESKLWRRMYRSWYVLGNEPPGRPWRLSWSCRSFKRYAWEEAEHAAKFAELLGDCVWDTKTNLEKRMNAESGACEDKKRIATRAKALNLDAIHDTVHEMAKDEARHGKGFEGLYNRYFKK